MTPWPKLAPRIKSRDRRAATQQTKCRDTFLAHRETAVVKRLTFEEMA